MCPGQVLTIACRTTSRLLLRLSDSAAAKALLAREFQKPGNELGMERCEELSVTNQETA